jgi:hypothetical protein
MSRGQHVLRAAIVAAGLALARFFVGFTDPTYYEPETFLDYSAALLTTGSGIATAVALWVWGSAQDRRVPVVLLRLAALAYASWGLGNLFEDVIGWSWGDPLFVLGGMVSVLVLVAAAMVLLLTDSAWRWSGFVPFGLAVALGLEEPLITAITWAGLAAALAIDSVRGGRSGA